MLLLMRLTARRNKATITYHVKSGHGQSARPSADQDSAIVKLSGQGPTPSRNRAVSRAPVADVHHLAPHGDTSSMPFSVRSKVETNTRLRESM